MKKLILLFALLFTVSTSFISCRETNERDSDDIEEGIDEAGDELEEVGDEMEDEMDDMDDDM
ncbi:hypothetical protein [Salinimicrobium flavum]|uniref:Uncharacterized protein n=1 Tax=Salinimicrobium flavum TaxID=1737065 RepID=A0ABW5ITJ1_9FLAO